MRLHFLEFVAYCIQNIYGVFTARIRHIHRVIPAVHVQVRPGQGCDHNAIRADKLPDLRVVVPALKVVHACLFVPVVAAVAEGVPFPDGACQGSGGADGVAPGVIFIPYHFRAVFVNQGDDVVLGVPDVEIAIAAGRHADQLPCAVVAEVGYGAAFLPGKDPAARQTEVCDNSVHGLSDAQAVMVVLVLDGMAVADRRKLFPLRPGVRPGAARQHVAAGIICDGLAVKAGHLVLPGVAVRNVDRSCHAARIAGCVCVLPDRGQVPAQVVGVQDGLIEERVILPGHLVPFVIDVAPGLVGGYVLDGLDVAVVIIGVLDGLPTVHHLVREEAPVVPVTRIIADGLVLG